MIALTYRIHLNEPAIFAALEGDPNSAVSYPYIPGSAVRGMMIGRFIRQQRAEDTEFVLDAAQTDAKRRFFSQTTCYLNAYPVIGGERALPVPATWSIPKYRTKDEKEKGIALSDAAFRNKQSDDSGERRKPKTLSGFTYINQQTAFVYDPKMAINVHTQRARRDAGEQQVFRYEAIAADEVFAGVILCDSEADVKMLFDLLTMNTDISLGGSRTAGYGHAMITDVQQVDTWMEAPLYTNTADTVLTFLSDTLLRTDSAEYMPTADAIQSALAAQGVMCDVDPVRVKTTWVGGFNRKWGLPLPQTPAIERSSVVWLRNIKATQEKLQALQQWGLGERREDGFGRVALNWQQNTSLTHRKYPPENITGNEPEKVALDDISETSQKLWQAMYRRMEERQIEEEITRMIYQDQAVNYVIRGDISRTQLARVRSLIADELRKKAPDRQILQTFVEQTRGKASGRQLDSAYIGGKALSAWLKSPAFPGFDESVTSNDRYVLRLIDHVLERAHRDQGGAAQRGEN